MTVYVFDRTDGLVKIIKRGKYYYVHRLKEILVDRKGKKRFVFERASKRYTYKPYEDDDVTDTADVYFEDVKRWHFFKIHHKI